MIADPEEPVSFAAFSVEQKPYDLDVPIISPASEINERKHPDADDTALGKFYPVIIGKAGQTRREQLSSSSLPLQHTTTKDTTLAAQRMMSILWWLAMRVLAALYR